MATPPQQQPDASGSKKHRRIIVCLDGTWDTPSEQTNVFEFFNRVDTETTDENWEIRTSYHTGVGTDGFKLLGGSSGYGISDQIISAYKFVCQNYRDENDEIWLIGFSRGAFAARSLSGLIYNSGLLPEKNLAHAQEAYDLYRDRKDETRPNAAKAIEFKEKYECVLPMIHFLGCFDTVGELGVPKLPWYLFGSTLYSLFLGLHGFHDENLTPNVKNAYHAISIHDQRKWFTPTLMHFSIAAQAAENQTLEQVWFPGMHSDVGGGQANGSPLDNLLTCHSLRWMMDRATRHGLKLRTPEEEGEFIFNDSYNDLFVYRVVPRTDRVIERDINTNRYMANQLYKDGDFFNNLMTREQMDMYPSRTLVNFNINLEEQNNNNGA